MRNIRISTPILDFYSVILSPNSTTITYEQSDLLTSAKCAQKMPLSAYISLSNLSILPPCLSAHATKVLVSRAESSAMHLINNRSLDFGPLPIADNNNNNARSINRVGSLSNFLLTFLYFFENAPMLTHMKYVSLLML